jgi:hypothetical protein
MHRSDFRRKKVPFRMRKCWSLQRPKWMNYCQENPISYENNRFMKPVPQWRFSCKELKRLLCQNEGNFRYTWERPDKWQLYGQMLIIRGQLSDWSAISIRWHLLNARFSICDSRIMSINYWRNSGLRQLVPEAYSLQHLLKWRLL